MGIDRELHAQCAERHASDIVKAMWSVAYDTDADNSANLFVAILACALGTGLGLLETMDDVPANFAETALGQLEPYILALAEETSGRAPANPFPFETRGTA